jgi:hypothetical protein
MQPLNAGAVRGCAWEGLLLGGMRSVTYYGAGRTCAVAKRLECAQLAAALDNAGPSKSGSKLRALQTLRAVGMSLVAYVSGFVAART